MTTKEQYRLALSLIRLVRSHNRVRASGDWSSPIDIQCIREVLHFSIERHVLDAALRTIIQSKYDDAACASWTMSNRLLKWHTMSYRLNSW